MASEECRRPDERAAVTTLSPAANRRHIATCNRSTDASARPAGAHRSQGALVVVAIKHQNYAPPLHRRSRQGIAAIGSAVLAADRHVASVAVAAEAFVLGGIEVREAAEVTTFPSPHNLSK